MYKKDHIIISTKNTVYITVRYKTSNLYIASGFSANGDMFTKEEEGNQPHSDDNHMISDVIEEQEEPMEDHKTRMLYLQQTPFWRKCVNVNAIVVMTVTAFLYGFFY